MKSRGKEEERRGMVKDGRREKRRKKYLAASLEWTVCINTIDTVKWASVHIRGKVVVLVGVESVVHPHTCREDQ